MIMDPKEKAAKNHYTTYYLRLGLLRIAIERRTRYIEKQNMTK